VIGADEMLAAALDPLTGRASRIAATQASTSSGIDFAANAQAAADVGLVDVWTWIGDCVTSSNRLSIS
jgi:hypothetical protein